MVLLFFLTILALFFALRFLSKYKVPKVGCICLVTGGVKTGKTNLSVYMAIKEYKKRLRFAKFKNIIRRLLGKDPMELPLLYSNIPLGVPYVQLTRPLLLRETRFRYGSVVYICEQSLVADSTLIRDMELNETLLMFYKLFGHESHGGKLFVDTQCVADCHHSLKRSMSNYIYIHHLVKWIPFICVAYVRELMYSDDGSTVNTFNKDAEDAIDKLVIIPKWVWKKYDRYCYSILTDNLPVEDNEVVADSLKTSYIVSFKKSKLLEVQNNEKEND